MELEIGVYLIHQCQAIMTNQIVFIAQKKKTRNEKQNLYKI